MTPDDIIAGRDGLDPGSPPEPEPRASWDCGCRVDPTDGDVPCKLHWRFAVPPDHFRDDPDTATISDMLRRALRTAVARVGAGMAPMTAVDRTAEDFGL